MVLFSEEKQSHQEKEQGSKLWLESRNKNNILPPLQHSHLTINNLDIWSDPVTYLLWVEGGLTCMMSPQHNTRKSTNLPAIPPLILITDSNSSKNIVDGAWNLASSNNTCSQTKNSKITFHKLPSQLFFIKIFKTWITKNIQISNVSSANKVLFLLIYYKVKQFVLWSKIVLR